MSFKEFIKELNGSRIEGELIKTIFYSLTTSILILSIFYFVNDTNIIKNGYFLLFSISSYSLIIPTIRQVRAYREFACMPGMMIGMTSGMISGFLTGFYVGSTNGMFVGSLFGMFVGIILGVWLGYCCGIMGFLEGIMAGFMGGLMGGMTAVMLFNDNLKIAAIFIFIFSSIILFSLNYMIFKEMKETKHQLKIDHFMTFLISSILTFITVLLMSYGPRSVLFQ